MGDSGHGLRNRVQGFRDTLERATTYDSWGQVLEAYDEYTKLCKDIEDSVAAGSIRFNEHQVTFLKRLKGVVLMRQKASMDLSGEVGIKLEQVLKLIPLLSDLPEKVPAEFPIHVAGQRRDVDAMLNTMSVNAQRQTKREEQFRYEPQRPVTTSPTGGDLEEDESERDTPVTSPPQRTGKKGKKGAEADAEMSYPLKARMPFPGQTAISIKIDKIRLKDPMSYIEPFFSVTICDRDGKVVRGGERQDTAKVRPDADDYITVNQTVHLQLPLDEMDKDTKIFFEFKHYKARKQKTSTKCFSILEPDELQDGQLPMELYQKPTDWRGRKLNLLTDKAHYLYVTITNIKE